MPVYDYRCRKHGIFNELAAMDKAADPFECPHCGALSPRVILIPPAVLDMAPAKRKALSRNEKSRFEPISSSAESRAEQRERKQHSHGKGCGCSPELSQSALRQQVVLLPDGSKVFPSQRPWMISH